VERIVQSAEGRELSASAADGGVGGGDGGNSPPVGSPPARITGAGAPGGPLTAAEIGRLSVLCASLEQQQQTVAVANAAAAAAAANPLRQTDAEAAHSVLPGAAASDDDEYGGAAASDACPPLSGWAGVDGDVLAQLIPMLERHVRSASNVDLVGEARAVAEHGQAGGGGGGGGGGRKKKKAKAAAAGGSSGGSSGEDDEDGGNDNNNNNNNKAATVGEVRCNWELRCERPCMGMYLCMYVDVVGVGRSMILFCFCWLVDRTAVPTSRPSRRDLLSIDHCHIWRPIPTSHQSIPPLTAIPTPK